MFEGDDQMPTFRQTYQLQLQIAANQARNALDIPTRDPTKPMQLVGVSASATNALTNVVLKDIVTVVESNGLVAKPVDNGKPDIEILAGATLRLEVI
jgi:selenophosphate synthase